MFEALMPDLFVPEAKWGPRSWGRNHPATVAGQIEHGLRDAKYGYWGFSPASDPFGGYKVWGVDAMGMDPGGYPSDVEASNYDAGFGDCRTSGPAPTYGDGVVTRTPPSSRCRTPSARPWTTWRSSAPISTRTARAASTTRSRCAAARWPSGTWRSTRQ
ncbi:hypothetical protein [Phytohabitans rumicis]|uniref:Uncharacterized protein n=1 Tax=Phytohabitans rumicis TaxID=1076125 RepID=A0A6V8LDP8_9ACTN|nr:hypothetical protein [Phytohabitans rumicis]GFJ92709.1 hypothetical protein Prum_063510 [Phytohabitans rumicis]